MEQLETNVLKTALYDRHCALGAKIVNFSGWKMPVQYEGIIPEHHAVRDRVGIFDVSHMGRILVQGPEAEKFLDYLSTNVIAGKKDFSATYTVWSTHAGGCVDDVIVYKQDSTHFFVIVNAGNRQKDLIHVQNESRAFNVQVIDRYAEEGILAIQGPLSQALLAGIFPEAVHLPIMNFCYVTYEGQAMILSHTGYTGASGFEIYAPIKTIVNLWDRLLLEGKTYGISPIGLGARDTLRLEMGYALYGHEISDEISAVESVSAWTVKWKKPEFLGKKALQKIEESSSKRSEYGVVLLDPGIVRAGYEVYKDDIKVGVVTSGSYSPTLNQAIAIVLVVGVLQEGDQLEIQVRQHRCRAKVVKLPFVRGRT